MITVYIYTNLHVYPVDIMVAWKCRNNDCRLTPAVRALKIDEHEHSHKPILGQKS